MNYTRFTFDADKLQDESFLMNALVKTLHDYKCEYKEYPNHILIHYYDHILENQIAITAKSYANQKECLIIKDFIDKPGLL